MTGVKLYKKVCATLFGGFFVAVTLLSASAHAAIEGNFSLQVSPSPLVAVVKPGESKQIPLKIRNASTGTEELKMEIKAFRFDGITGQIKFEESAPRLISEWVSFAQPVFTVKPGEWFTQDITIKLPQETGFSYSFAIVITRTVLPTSSSAGQLLNGSVGVFTLLNVDRPGAISKLELTSLTASQTVYEYLPATINIKLKNTGNTIIQPYGNLFVNRGADATNTPAATLPVNGNQSYLLPNTERTLQATWSDGFPVYKTTNNGTGPPQTSLDWNWDNIKHFRFGRYTAKVVAVYNDGTRDVPIEKEVTFWVIPWKALLIVIFVITALVILLRLYIRKRTEKAVKRALAAQKHE